MAIKKVKTENSAKATTKKKDTVQIIPEGLEKKLQENLEDKDKNTVEVVVDTTPVIEVAEKPQVTVQVEPQPESAPTPEKRVRILMKEDHKCCIGGEWYYLLKGKYYNVPENVKNILMNADKLSPL